MREIKFRAWDKDEEEMIYGMNKCLMNWDGLQHNVNGFFDGDIPVMQYTGLKDKSGKEIYEGDIVCHDHKYKKWTQVIEWGEHEDGEGCGIFGYYLSECVSTDGKIIGNIYENPDLLKGRKDATK